MKHKIQLEAVTIDLKNERGEKLKSFQVMVPQVAVQNTVVLLERFLQEQFKWALDATAEELDVELQRAN